MELTQAKERFIESWGQMGINWGSNKTMSQIHALLLISVKPLNTDQIMDMLKISRGNVHTNLNQLMEWEIINKSKLTGCRKDYYEAEKDLWKTFKMIIKHRKKKELEPIIGMLGELKQLDCNCSESSEFCKVVEELHLFAKKTDHALDNIVSSKSSWLVGNYLKLMK